MSATPEHSRILGFDVGARWLGVACGSALTGLGQPLGVLETRAGAVDWAGLDRMLREWSPDMLLVGLPLTLAGDEQPASARARAFALAAGARYRLPVALQDERGSSREASARFAQARRAGVARRRQAANIDALAAVVIVERYLGSLAQFDAVSHPIEDL